MYGMLALYGIRQRLRRPSLVEYASGGMLINQNDIPRTVIESVDLDYLWDNV